MDNKIIHYSSTQSIPDTEFKPILRGESPYYGNLNRPAQSAYNFATNIAQVQSWGGLVSILQPINQVTDFSLYQIVIIDNTTELVTLASGTEDIHSRLGIVVAESGFNNVSATYENICVSTFCPNFLYPLTPSWSTASNGSRLYLTLPGDSRWPTDPDITGPCYYLSTTAGSSGIFSVPIAIKTGPRSVFFAGTARIFSPGLFT